MSLDIGVDLQIQIFILAGVFGFIFILIVFFLAGICGQLSKLKRQQRKLLADRTDRAHITGYDNYAYNSRNIQPDEELGRRGFTMYDPYQNANQPNVHQNVNNGKHESVQDNAQPTTTITVSETALTETAVNVEGTHDATS